MKSTGNGQNNACERRRKLQPFSRINTSHNTSHTPLINPYRITERLHPAIADPIRITELTTAIPTPLLIRKITRSLLSQEMQKPTQVALIGRYTPRCVMQENNFEILNCESRKNDEKEQQRTRYLKVSLVRLFRSLEEKKRRIDLRKERP